MILKGGDIARYLARPDPSRPALLIYGREAMRVSLKRAEAVASLVGERAEEEMRLSRLSGDSLRKDPAALHDAIKEVGFFPGQRVVQVDDAQDKSVDAIRIALEAWGNGDAIIVVTAGGLAKSSPLRKLFEAHPQAMTAPIYDDPPGEAEISGWLTEAGLRDVPRDALQDITLLAKTLEPGDLRQTIEKIGLYKFNDPSPLTVEEIALLAPATIETDVDMLLNAVADRRPNDLARMMHKISGQGLTPISICIAALRHFRALHAAASDPQGPISGLTRMRPPVFGPRRDRMAKQAQSWGVAPLETAITLILDTDLTLRSAQRAPQMPLVERMLIRLAMSRGPAR